MTVKTQQATKWLVAAMALVIAFRLACMAWLPLMDTTEARYAEIGRKMLAMGDWITPWHDKLPFWGKPPLSFWLTAASFSAFGINEFAARLPHFLCLVFVAWLAWSMADRRSRSEGLLTIALLAGSSLFFISAGAVMTDEALVVGTTLAMRGFWLHLHRDAETSGKYQWQLFLGVAIGLLAKGPLALVLVFLPILAWTFGTSQTRHAWRKFAWLRGLFCAVLLVSPWYVAAELKTPGFLEYFLAGEHWHRFVTPGWQGDLYGNAHRFPPGTIWVCAVAATLPWSLLLPVIEVRRRRLAGPVQACDARERHWRLYLACWSLAPLVFFTAARNIIWTYVLPALPAMALLSAAWLQERMQPERALRLVASGLCVTVLASLAFGAHLYSSDSVNRKSAKALVAAWHAQAASNEPLVFIGLRLHSAAFYSGGKADLQPSVVAAQLALAGRPAYLAIDDESSILEASRDGRYVGRFGRYHLFEVGKRSDEAAAR